MNAEPEQVSRHLLYMRRRIARLVNYILALSGIGLRRRASSISAYIPAAETVLAANGAGLSVCDYVEAIWNIKGQTAYIIEQMRNAGCFKACEVVCEIGPGTARYLEKTLEETECRRYEFYEVADDWASWIAHTYGPVVIRRPTDGQTLAATVDDSCDLVASHGVFVYLPMLHILKYLNECARVTRIGGYIVFDCFTEQEFPPEIIDAWLSGQRSYPVIVPSSVLLNYCERANLSFCCEFSVKYGAGLSRYFIFQKKLPSNQ